MALQPEGVRLWRRGWRWRRWRRLWSHRLVLDSPRRALYVPAMVWNDLSEMTPETVLLCLASGEYDEAEYIRDRPTFQGETASR